ncbi:hypothetical protein, partial [Streptomyces noursei]|uniref:hypothetical protein n=1 Tax=Streptomyces noursei TaxID=1971 RepID=UPI0035DE4E38
APSLAVAIALAVTGEEHFESHLRLLGFEPASALPQRFRRYDEETTATRKLVNFQMTGNMPVRVRVSLVT